MLLLLGTLLFTAACKKDTLPTVSESDISNLNIRPLDFKYLSTRSKVNFDDGKQRIAANANIRIRKDSLIWFSITPGFGIEAARGLVTRDSIFLINKLQREYHAYSFAELSRRMNVVVDYDILEAALLGDPIVPITTYSQVRRTQDETIVLQKQQKIDIINYFSNQPCNKGLHLLQVLAPLGQVQLHIFFLILQPGYGFALLLS